MLKLRRAGLRRRPLTGEQATRRLPLTETSYLGCPLVSKMAAVAPQPAMTTIQLQVPQGAQPGFMIQASVNGRHQLGQPPGLQPGANIFGAGPRDTGGLTQPLTRRTTPCWPAQVGWRFSSNTGMAPMGRTTPARGPSRRTTEPRFRSRLTRPRKAALRGDGSYSGPVPMGTFPADARRRPPLVTARLRIIAAAVIHRPRSPWTAAKR